MKLTLKTRLHTYYFILPRDSEAYNAMRADIEKDGPRHWMNSWGGADKVKYQSGITTEDVELETDFIFSDQWNTTDGRRVFDHYEEYPVKIEKSCKRGHWLEITDEMRELRRNQNVCGYCGTRYYAPKGYVFCLNCLDSEYLKEEDLHLLRLISCEEHNPKRKPLSDAEREHLLPLYRKAQTEGNQSRAVNAKHKLRENLKRERERSINAAETKYNGFMWLLDHGVNTENCIYYSHTDKFSFGWLSPVSDAVKSDLLDILVEFPFDYEIKTSEAA